MAVTASADRSELDELKARVDLVEFFRAHGLEPKQVGSGWMCRCPFHDDRQPSLSIDRERGLWNCFGCQASGDVLSFLQRKENLDFPAAVAALKSWSGQPDDLAAEKRTKRTELTERLAHLYHQAFWESVEAQNFLTARGLGERDVWQAFRLGWCDGTVLARLPQEGLVAEVLRETGLVNAEGKEHFRGCLVVPLTHPDRGVVGFYGRRLSSTAATPHLYLPGPRQGVLNWVALKTSARVYLTESVLDALSLWQAGIRETTCLHGLASVPADLKALMKQHKTREAVLVLDGDRPGREAVPRFTETLEGLGLAVSALSLPDDKDPNDLLRELGPTRLAEWVAAAEKPLEPSGPRWENDSQGFLLELGDVRYDVRLLPPFSSRLRIRLCGQRGEAEYLDKLDLYVQRARQQAVREIAKTLKLQRFEAETHLKCIRERAEDWVQRRGQHTEGATKIKAAAVDMTEPERLEALQNLKEPGLAGRVLDDMEALGYVGEEDAKLLAYLIGVSRKLAKPLSGIIFAQSGVGKSSLADLVEFLTPPDEVLHFTRLTSQALYYFPTALSHMLILVEERTGAEAADYSIRALQSQHKLRQAVPIKDPMTGQFKTQILEVEGPIAYLETTTATRINHENATRSFELYLDESEEQTRKIHAAQRRARLPVDYNREQRRLAIQRRHHAMQKLLEPVQVGIPFVELIGFPSHRLRTRRDHERFLCLVEASAFLHQHQRVRGQTEDGSGYVLASTEDYGLAYTLAREVLASSLHELGRGSRELWQQLVAWIGGDSPDATFTRKDVRLALGLEDHRLRDALADLVEMEYLEATAGSNGKQYSYRLLVRDTKGVRIPLLPPAELEARWAARST